MQMLQVYRFIARYAWTMSGIKCYVVYVFLKSLYICLYSVSQKKFPYGFLTIFRLKTDNFTEFCGDRSHWCRDTTIFHAFLVKHKNSLDRA